MATNSSSRKYCSVFRCLNSGLCNPELSFFALPSEQERATASKNAIVDLRPQPFPSDRLPTPLTFVYAASFYTFRVLRWAVGLGMHTDWLEDPHRLRPGLENLAHLVDTGRLQPVLDKVYMPQDFENALAHACSEDAIGTTVIRFP